MEALGDLVRHQSLLPGRKTVLFLSEGLVMPPGLPEILGRIIGEANRFNVSFYTVDANGLETTRAAALSNAAGGALSSTSVTDYSRDPSSANMKEPSLEAHTNWQSNLRELAEGTGGFAMDNSNDLRVSLRKLMEEIGSHYELTYVPESDRLDGHFRRIQVRVRRRGMIVQARSGYFALP